MRGKGVDTSSPHSDTTAKSNSDNKQEEPINRGNPNMLDIEGQGGFVVL